MSPHRTPTEALRAADLRARGSLKWTRLESEIAAWVAESDLGTAPEVLAALHTAVDAQTFGYLPPALRRELGEACSAWHETRYGWAVLSEWVHPVADVAEALRITVERYSRPGSPLILPTPAYMPFLTAPRMWGREVIEVPMRAVDGRCELDLDGVDRAFRSGGHLLVLVNPHNPTGRVMAGAEHARLSDVVAQHGGRVFSDEIHAPLVHPGHRHRPYAASGPAAAAHTVTATSASKAWNIPGLKCAQILLSNAEDAERWREIDTLATHGASTLGVLANTAAYRSGARWLDGELLPALDSHRTVLAEALAEHAPEIAYRAPEGTYLAWLDLRAALEHAGAPEVAHHGLARRILQGTGVAVTDGAACGAAGAGFVRLNLAMPRPMVVEAARQLGDWLRSDLRRSSPR